MIKQVFKTVFAGILVGIAIFLMPFFLLKFLAIVFLFKVAFRLLGFGRRGRFTHKFKNMTEEEKAAFMQKFGNRCNRFSKKFQSENSTEPLV